MPLIIALLGFFIIKGIFQLPFYLRQWKKSLLVAIFTSLTVVPLITILYHETSIDFTLVYTGMILLDIVLLYLLVQNNWWKAIPAALIVNTIAILYFFIGNG
jgi:hypothetical protein